MPEPAAPAAPTTPDPAPAAPTAPSADTRDDAAAFIRARREAEGTPAPAEPPAAPAEVAAPAPPVAAAAEKPAEKPAEQPKSSQAAAFIRRENAVAARERKAEAREREVQARAESYQAQLTELDKLDEAALLGWAAKRRGVSVATLLRTGAALISGQKPEPAAKPERDPDVAALRAEIEALKGEHQKRAETQLETEWRGTVERLATEHEDRFPHLTARAPEEISAMALDVTRRYIDRQGLAPTFEAVLEYLESEEAAAFSRTRARLEARSGGKPPAVTPPTGGSRPGTGPAPSAQAARTISNADASHPASSTRVLTERERLDDVAEFFRSRAS